MKKKVIICSILVLMIVVLFGNVSNAYVNMLNYMTVTFKNISPANDVYILINKDYGLNFALNEFEEDAEKEIKQTSGISFIEEQYKKGKYENGLEDVHEDFEYNNKTYEKIKVVGECSITYNFQYSEDILDEEVTQIKAHFSSPVLCAKISDDNVEIIVNDHETESSADPYKDIFDKLGYQSYHIEREGYGGDTVLRKFIEYDGKTNTAKNVTNEEIEIEEKKVTDYAKKMNRMYSLERYKPFIIIGLCCFVLIIVLVFLIIKKRKQHNIPGKENNSK